MLNCSLSIIVEILQKSSDLLTILLSSAQLGISVQSLTEITIDSQDLPEGRDRVMARIVNAALKQRFQERVVLPDRTDNAYRLH